MSAVLDTHFNALRALAHSFYAVATARNCWQNFVKNGRPAKPWGIRNKPLLDW
jgi:hypothetical protein